MSKGIVTHAAKYELTNPESSTVYSDCTYRVDINIDPENESSNAANIIIHYNPSILSVIDEDTETPGTQIALGNAYAEYYENTVDQANGIIRLTGGSINTPISSTKLLAYFRFEPKSTGQTSITIDFEGGETHDSNIAESNTSIDILNSVSDYSFDVIPGSCQDTEGPIITIFSPDPESYIDSKNFFINFSIADTSGEVDISSLLINIGNQVYTNNAEQLSITEENGVYSIIFGPTALLPTQIEDFIIPIQIQIQDELGNKSTLSTYYKVMKEDEVEISNATVTIDNKIAYICWETNIDTIGYIRYKPSLDTTKAYESRSIVEESYATSHCISITIDPELPYTFEIVASSRIGKIATKILTKEAGAMDVSTSDNFIDNLINAPQTKKIIDNTFSNPEVPLIFIGIATTSITTGIALSPYSTLYAIAWLRNRKKKKTFGFIYDEKKNVPVPFTLIEVFKKKTLVKRVVTDTKGQYFLVLDKGTYKLTAKQAGYKPENINITIKKDNTNITEVIKLTGTKSALSFHQFRSIFRNLFKTLNKTLFFIGFIWAIIATAISFGAINLIVLTIYSVQILTWIIQRPRTNWGWLMVSKTNQGIPGALVQIYNQETGDLVSSQLTDKKGRFNMVSKYKKIQIKIDTDAYKIESIKRGKKKYIHNQLFILKHNNAKKPLIIEVDIVDQKESSKYF